MLGDIVSALAKAGTLYFDLPLHQIHFVDEDGFHSAWSNEGNCWYNCGPFVEEEDSSVEEINFHGKDHLIQGLLPLMQKKEIVRGTLIVDFEGQSIKLIPNNCDTPTIEYTTKTKLWTGHARNAYKSVSQN